MSGAGNLPALLIFRAGLTPSRSRAHPYVKASSFCIAYRWLLRIRDVRRFCCQSDFGKVTHSGIPDVNVIQAAYDLAAIPENTKYDKDIKGKGNGYRCFVSFINQRDGRVTRRI